MSEAAETVPEAPTRRGSIATMLLWCFVVLSFITIVAAIVALALFSDVRRKLTRITDQSFEEISVSFGLVDEATRLAADVRLMADARDREELENQFAQVSERLAAIEALGQEYAELEGTGAEPPDLLNSELRENADILRQAVEVKLEAETRRFALLADLNRDQDAFIAQIGPIVEAERDAILTSSRQAVTDGASQIGTLIDGSFEALRALLQIEANANYISAILYLAASDDKLPSLDLRRTALVEPIASIKGALGQLDATEGGPALGALAMEIAEAGFEPRNIVELRRAQLGGDGGVGTAGLLRDKLHLIVALQAQFRRRAETVLDNVDREILAANAGADATGRQMIDDMREDLRHLETIMAINVDANLLFGVLNLAGVAALDRQLSDLADQQQVLSERLARGQTQFGHGPATGPIAAALAAPLGYLEGERSILAARRAELAAATDARAIGQETEELTALMGITARVFATNAERASARVAGELHASLARGQTILQTLAVVSLILVALITWFLVYRHIVRWLKRISELMHELAAGNLEVAIPASTRRDEIGEMARALTVFQSNAIRRRRAEEALKVAKDEAEKALAELKSAQQRLVQTEKMASLGQLTAGIAHEIKNPLNFVNNFAKLTDELMQELTEILEKPMADLDPEARDDAEDLIQTMRGNLVKVSEHGARADSIVRNMLAHSREGPSEDRTVEVNALVEEALNLAYHGARAESPGLNIDIERVFAEDAGQVQCFPQELLRVFLNVINNAIYAATRKDGGEGFQPKLRVTTRTVGKGLEVEVRDNGPGIPEDVRQRIFDPFFTTKPAGEGTGLGLSLSFDVVAKQHGGEMVVTSEPGESTTFVIRLPRTLPASAAAD